MNFETILRKIPNFEILERHPWNLEQRYKPWNDTMNFETILWKSFKILEYLVRYYELWNLGIISMNFETILRKIPWVLKSWNDIHEICNNIISFETTLWILKWYYERVLKFWITWKDIMNFEILKRHSWNLETTLWILKRYYEKHHKFWNLGTISMTLGTKLQLSKRHYEFWNDTTKDIMNFEILEYLERHREF